MVSEFVAHIWHIAMHLFEHHKTLFSTKKMLTRARSKKRNADACVRVTFFWKNSFLFSDAVANVADGAMSPLLRGVLCGCSRRMCAISFFQLFHSKVVPFGVATEYNSKVWAHVLGCFIVAITIS